MGINMNLTLPALQRLLTEQGDPDGTGEATIALRHQVAEEFARRHIKTILNDETYQAFHAKLLAECRLFISERYGVSLNANQYASRPVAVIERTFADQVGPLIEKMVSDLITSKVEKAMQDREERLVQQAVRRATDKLDAVMLLHLDRVATERVYHYMDQITEAFKPLATLATALTTPGPVPFARELRAMEAKIREALKPTPSPDAVVEGGGS